MSSTRKPSEREVVRSIAAELDGKVRGLMDHRSDYHLGGPGPEAIAEKWELGSLKVDLQPDLILVFRDYPGARPFLAAVEVKVFPNLEQARIHEGWGQALAYALFGFDGIALWHFFLEEIPKARGNQYHMFGEQLAAASGVGLWFFAGRIDVVGSRIKTPWEADMDFSSFVEWAYVNLRQNPSSILAKESFSYVRRRRIALLTDLKVPPS